MLRSQEPPRVLLACAGLDHAHRGFESFARDCFDALAGEPGLSLELARGSGIPAPKEYVARTLRRDRSVALGLGRILGFRPFRLEALSFALGLQPLLVRRVPELVYLSEWDTARGLALLRRLTGQRFKLLLCNGGFSAAGFSHLDHVQELTPAARAHVLAHGADPTRHTVLPLGFTIPREPDPPSPEERADLRRRLNLPAERTVLLSVAAVNRRHKRLDYVIDELSRMPEPRPFLLMVGEPDAETTTVHGLATARLGREGFAIRTVPFSEMGHLYRASDLFVLASLVEAQGRAAIEAGAHDLPCLLHDGPVMRFALGEHGYFGDLTQSGTLVRLLTEQKTLSHEARLRRCVAAHHHVYQRFSWDRLRSRYVELLTRVARANSTVSSATGDELRR